MRFYTRFKIVSPDLFRLDVTVALDESFWEPEFRGHLAWVLNAYLPAQTVLKLIPPPGPLLVSRPMRDRLSYTEWQNAMYEF